MQHFYMTVGPSGSGKTTWAYEYVNNHNDVVLLDSDEMREQLYSDWADQSHNAEVFKRMNLSAIAALREGCSVIYCATNLNMKKRISTLRFIQQSCRNNEITYHCNVFTPEPEELYKNNAAREHTVPVYVIKRQIANFQMPVMNEGWDSIALMRDGNTDKYLALRDDICEKMKNFGSQQNPHHTLSLRDHCIKCADIIYKSCNKCYSYCDLYTAAWWHDCGKIDTQKFDADGVAHYYNHENVGAYYAAVMGFNNRVIQLINYHMLPYNEQAAPAWRERLGEQLWFNIMLLHNADEGAH